MITETCSTIFCLEVWFKYNKMIDIEIFLVFQANVFCDWQKDTSLHELCSFAVNYEPVVFYRTCPSFFHETVNSSRA